MHNKYSILLILTVVVSLVSCNRSNNTWKDNAVNELHQYNFTNVEKIINSLSNDEKVQNQMTIDSLKAMMDRIRYDFSLSRADGISQIKEKFPEINDSIVEDWKNKKYIETINIDGKEMWFRKAVRNLWLLNNEEFGKENLKNKKKGYAEVYKDYVEIMASMPDSENVRSWRRVDATFVLDVKPNVVPEGEIIRAWLPIPFENGRQRNIKVISTSSKSTMSEGSVHHTVYMEQKAEKDKPTHFEMKFSYEVGAQVFPLDSIMARLKPYDKSSDMYKQYTSQVLPHMIVNDDMKSLATKLVGQEQNPVRQVSKIYDWIAGNFPWAGARDYSTLPNIPEYVLEINHGDCGQVSLLLISLLRSIGIPARWESGWEVTKDGAGYHDWAEIYFEGIGWVPSDMSFGRTVNKEYLNDFYKTSIDANRLASNEGICSPLSPAKKFIRYETVDFQAGEVEWKNGNIPTKDWNSDLIIENVELIK